MCSGDYQLHVTGLTAPTAGIETQERIAFVFELIYLTKLSPVHDKSLSQTLRLNRKNSLVSPFNQLPASGG